MYKMFTSLGGLLAIYLSWIANTSFWWCVLHMLFGWLYVVYWMCTHADKIPLIVKPWMAV
jgi:hypothetical protein